MQQISATDLQQMDRRVRATFFNMLSGFKSPVLVGTGSAGQTLNLALFSSLVHIGSNPPLLGLILRPTTVPRHTYDNLRRNKAYTLNHVPETLLAQAHQTSAKYPEDQSEFEATGLSPVFTEGFPAPYVEGSPLRMGLRPVEEHLIEANGTRLLVGEVTEIWTELPPGEDGWFDPSEANLPAVAGLEGYFRTRLLERLSYARP